MNLAEGGAKAAGAPAILIAEDHRDSRDALRALLEAGGYRVHLAEDGAAAVEKARALRPDLILMDIMMPRVDGLEATRRLRRDPQFEQVPIVALTAMTGGEEQALAAGCDDCMFKPIDVSSFFRRIHGWLQDGRGPRIDAR